MEQQLLNEICRPGAMLFFADGRVAVITDGVPEYGLLSAKLQLYPAGGLEDGNFYFDGHVNLELVLGEVKNNYCIVV